MKPQENVYSVARTGMPDASAADAKGFVLFYSRSVGWHIGFYSSPWKKDITHWTYLPLVPPAEEE